MGTSGKEIRTDDIKVLSLNCQHSHKYGNLQRFLGTIMDEQTYDVILLQEADAKIVKALTSKGDYVLTRSESGDKEHLTCIVSKKEYPLSKMMGVKHFPHKELDEIFKRHHLFGMVSRKIEIHGKVFVFASVHLPSGFNPLKRRKHLQEVIDELRESYQQERVIIGGDFNLGYPFELEFTRDFVAPDYRLTTLGLPPTLDSFHTEKDTTLTGRISQILRAFGTRIRLRADHILVSRGVSEEYDTSTSVIQFEQKGAISDHSPIVMYLYPKKSST